MKTKFLVGAIGLTLVFGCGRNERTQYDLGELEYDAPAIKAYEGSDNEFMPPPPPPEATFAEAQKLIKQGYLQFETENLDVTSEHILREAKKVGGYIANDSERKEHDRHKHYATIKVPAAQFDAFITGISTGIKHFDEKNISVTDVTEQFVDLDARLKTKKQLEARYHELLNQAKNVKDMLEIEREIGSLRADIESMEGTFRVLKHQISYATIEVQYYVLQIETERGFGHKFGQALRGGWDNLMGFLVGLIYIWPFVLIFGVLAIWLIRRTKKRWARG
jgi:hypothetical protein